MLTSLNGRELWPDSKRSQLLFHLQFLSVDIRFIHETYFDYNFSWRYSKVYQPFSACFDDCSKGITWQVSRFVNVTCTQVLSDSGGKALRSGWYHKGQNTGVYGTNVPRELPDFFLCIDLFMTLSRRVVLEGGCNAILNPKFHRGELVGFLTIWMLSTFVNLSWDLISSINSGKGIHLR